MTVHKNIFLTLIICCSHLFGFSQQDPMFTHYMYNTQVVNPAYAGSRDALTVAGLTRWQWVGFEGAPATQTLSINTPLFVKNLGVGVAISRDAIAKTHLVGAQLDLTARLPVGKRSQLSFGLKGSLWRFSESLAELDIRDSQDQLFMDNYMGRNLPNIGAGFYFKHERFYVGLSVPELLENRLRTNEVIGGISGLKQRHYYFITGALFHLQDRIDLKPTLFIKYTNNAPIQVGATAQFVFYEKFLVGPMYRYNSAVGLLVGFNFTEQFNLGYSYDWSISNLTSRYNNGSHEIVLRYDFLFDHSRNAPSSRYF